ncbi:MAG: hypothetical protein HY231_24635 [Acidobacteria bacterium]|nr:hypothetical protein [Acidobacteriota bacterium]
MKTKSADRQPDNGNKALHLHIADRDGQQFLVIKDHDPTRKIGAYKVEIPASLLPELKRLMATIEQNQHSESASLESTKQVQEVRFAHESEAEFARILDFYHVRWQYEPKSFVIERDATGKALRSFTPDFYLPDQDLFIELTTLKQALVTKKNRKLRQLREGYPEVNIKLLYASDYHKLIEKFAASQPRPNVEPEN